MPTREVAVERTPAPQEAPRDEQQLIEAKGFLFRNESGVVSVEDGGESSCLILTAESCRAFEGIEFGEGFSWWEPPLDPDSAMRVWVHVRARVTGSQEHPHVPIGALVEVLAIDSLTRDWIKAFWECEVLCGELSTIADQVPDPSKRTQILDQRDEAVRALRELQQRRGIGPVPASLLPLARTFPFRMDMEEGLADDILRATEPEGLAPEGLDRHDPSLRGRRPGLPDETSLEKAESGEREKLRVFGMEVEELDAQACASLVLPYGIRIRSLVPFGPAADAGALPGDLLWGLMSDYGDERLGPRLGPLGSEPDAAWGRHPGEKYIMYVWRSGQLLCLHVRLP